MSASNSMPPPDRHQQPQQPNWRDLMPRDERVKICRHIMTKLGSYYTNVSEDSLKQRTRSFEAKTFQSSKSREEYLNTIANCLTKVEEHVTQSRNNPSMPQQQPQPQQQAPLQQPPQSQTPQQQPQPPQPQPPQTQQQPPQQPSQQQPQQQPQTASNPGLGQPNLQREQSQQKFMSHQHLQTHQQQQLLLQQQQQPQPQPQPQPQTHSSPQLSQQSQPPGQPPVVPSSDQSTASQQRPSPSQSIQMQIQQGHMAGKKADASRKHRAMNAKHTSVDAKKKAAQAIGKASVGDPTASSPSSRSKSATVSDAEAYHLRMKPPNAVAPNGAPAPDYIQQMSQPQSTNPGLGPSMNAPQGSQQGPPMQNLSQPNGGPPGSTPAQVLSAQQQPHGFPQQAIRTSAGVPVAGPGTDGAPHPQPPQVRPTVDKKAFISAVIAGGRVLGRELTPQDVVNMGHEEVMKFLRAARMRMRPNNVNQSAMGVSQRNRLQQQQQQHGGAPSNVHQSNSAPGTNNAADNIGTWLGHIGNNARTQMPMNNQNTNGLNHTMPHQANVQDQSSAAALAGKQGRPQPQQQNFHGQPGANLIGGMSNPMGVASGGTIDSQKKPGMSSAPDGLQPGPGGARVGVPPGSYQMPPGQGGGAMDANTGAAGTGVINNKGGTVSSTPGVPAVVSDEELWNKHEEIKNKFKMPLKKLFPIIHKIHETRQVRNPEHFLRQLRDSYSILDLNRNNPKPPTLTFEMLGRVEQFIHRVIQVYSKYLLQTASNSEVGPEQRRQIQITIAGFQVGSSGSTTAPTPNANGADNSTDNQQNPGAADPSSLPQRPPQVNGPVGARTMSQTALKNDPSTSNPDASGMDMQDRHAFQYQQQHRLPPRMQPGQDGQAATALNRNQMMKRHSSHQQQQQHSGQPHPTNIPGHIAENGSLDHKNTQALAQRIPPSSQRIAMAKQNANAAPGQGYGQHSGMDLGVPGAMGHRGVPMPGGPQPHSGTVDGSGRPPAPSMINPKLGQQQAQTATPNQSQNSDQTSLEPNSTSLAQATLPPQHRQQQRLPMGNQGRIPGQQPHLQQHQQQQHQQQPPHAQNQTQHHHAQQGRHVKLPGAHMADGPGGAGSGVPGKIVNRPGTVGSGGADEGQSRQTKRALTFEQRLHMLDSKVKDAIDRVQQLEACVEQDSKRSKSERIHNTLAALRNNAGVTNSAVSGGSGNGAVKRQASLVDVDNFDPKVGSVRSKTVFECSYESGLRLAKRPKNEAADLKSLREAVEADCKAAKQRNPLLMIEIREEFGQPVVTCLLKIPQIRLPKLVLRVQRGYPRKGGATYGFERPPMGWVGVLDEIRTRFKQALATAPAASVGVAAFLDAWAQEADAVINGSKMSDSR